MRFLSMVMLALMFTSCDLSEFESLVEIGDDSGEEPDVCASITWEPEHYAVYSEVRSGFSCEEIEKRREAPERPTNNCSMANFDSAPETTNSSEFGSSQDNVEYPGVVEPRKYLKVGNYTYYLHQGFLFVRDLEGEEVFSEKIFFTDYASDLLLYHDGMIIAGNSTWNASILMFYSMDKTGHLTLQHRKNFAGHIKMRKVDELLYVYESSGKRNKDVNCEEVRFYSTQRYGSFHTIHRLNLDKDNFVFTIEGSYYGRLRFHTLKDSILMAANVNFGLTSAIVLHDQYTPKVTEINGELASSFTFHEKDNHIAAFYSRIMHNDNALGIFDKELNLVNELGFMGKNESIFSSRFEDDLAYVVTFRRIDPLYTIDISNIKKPALLSELKIPGVSRYLHKMNDNYMIGVGDTTGGWFDNQTEINLFDTSDLFNVRKVDSLIFDHSKAGFNRYHQDMLKFNDYFFVKQFDQLLILRLEGDQLIEDNILDNLHGSFEFFVHGNSLYVLSLYDMIIKSLYEVEIQD